MDTEPPRLKRTNGAKSYRRWGKLATWSAPQMLLVVAYVGRLFDTTLKDRRLTVPLIAFSICLFVLTLAAWRWAAYRPIDARRVRQGWALAAAGYVLIFISSVSVKDLARSAAELTIGIGIVVIGFVRAHGAGWAALAGVCLADLALAAIALLSIATGATSDRDGAALWATAFLVHAVCIGIAAWWSFSVSSFTPPESADRAKAGEAGRGLCGVWAVLFILISFDFSDILTKDFARNIVVAALTVAASVATMGSGYTKYVEGRESGHAWLKRERHAQLVNGLELRRLRRRLSRSSFGNSRKLRYATESDGYVGGKGVTGRT